MKNCRRGKQGGVSLLELLIVVAIIAAIAAMATGPLLDAYQQANETAALGAIKALHAAEAQYFSQNGRFADSIRELQAHLQADLATGKKSGYLFQIDPTAEGYQVAAKPERPKQTGRFSYFSDQTLLVRRARSPELAGRESAFLP